MQVLPTSITLTCGQNVRIRSLDHIRVIIFLCNVSNGSQPLKWTVYKDDEQYTTTTNASLYIADTSPIESDFGIYIFVLSSKYCGSTMKISRLIPCKFL